MTSAFQFVCYGTRVEKETSPWQFFESSPREGFDLHWTVNLNLDWPVFAKLVSRLKFDFF